MITRLNLPKLVVDRLSAVAKAKKTTPAKLALQALKELPSSPDSRRAIRAHRRGQSPADLGWIDSYEGQSDDDILALADSGGCWQPPGHVGKKPLSSIGARIPGPRTGTENIIMAAMAVVREVNNGGFDQFFRNSSKRYAFFAKDALLHIGRKDAAKIVGRAVGAIGLPKTAGGSAINGAGEAFEILDKKMSSPRGRRDEIFEECDVEFFNLTGLPDSLLAYARRHQGGLLRQS